MMTADRFDGPTRNACTPALTTWKSSLAKKNTKKAHLSVIKDFLDAGGPDRINTQVASIVDDMFEGSDAWNGKDAIRTLFRDGG